MIVLCCLFIYFATICSCSTSRRATLQVGTPESVGLLSAPLIDLEKNITAYITPANYGSATFNKVNPLYPGATVIIGHKNTVVSYFAVGNSKKYADVNGTLLPEDHQLPAEKGTIYDMASLTKMFTTIAALQQLEKRAVTLNATVASYIPEFAVNGKENVTILMLLTHTSGFDADPNPDLWIGYSTIAERRKAILDQAIIHPPGTTYLYSDLNFMSLQLVLEAVTSTPLDALVHDYFTLPLGMKDTYFNRGNKDMTERVAVTEFQIAALGPEEPQRPQPVWGTVHDENAWSTDGVSGHAGVFSTAMDLAIFCQMILNNGTYGGVRILKSETVDLIFHNYNTAFPGNAHGLGFELDQYYWSGPMASLQTAGHTGFTGTSMVIDRPSKTFFIFLTSRVHPSREWSNINIARENLGYFVAKSLKRML
ncbi:beta-lactamase/transpeptidase-like protein [Cyathus striatus]|nr:beta-lactamase/transpeptidase-like protein [Cyathus striatus]